MIKMTVNSTTTTNEKLNILMITSVLENIQNSCEKQMKCLSIFYQYKCPMNKGPFSQVDACI